MAAIVSIANSYSVLGVGRHRGLAALISLDWRFAMDTLSTMDDIDAYNFKSCESCAS
jgi:hypothetical protein